MKDNSCVTNLITFYNEMSGLVDEWRVVVVVYFNFNSISKSFDSVTCDIFKLMKHGLQKWRWIENRLNCHAQRVVATGTKSSWCGVVTTGILQGLGLSPELFNNFINGLEIVGQEYNLSKFADRTKLRWVLLFRGTWTGWINGLAGTSWHSRKYNIKSCTLRQITSHLPFQHRLESSFDEKKI